MDSERDAFWRTLLALRAERARAAELDAAIAVLEHRLGVKPGAPPPAAIRVASPAKKSASSQLAGKSLVDGAEEVLRQSGEPLHIRAIIERMQDGGLAKGRTVKNVRASLVGSLNRKANAHDTFLRVGAATYALVGNNGLLKEQ